MAKVTDLKNILLKHPIIKKGYYPASHLPGCTEV
jgi:hypothetical protein